MSDPKFKFKFSDITSYFEQVIENNYQVITCKDYYELKSKNRLNQYSKILVNRVDIDLSPKKAKVLAEMFNKLNIKGSFFIRLHANEYNPFSFENYKCLKFIRDTGHEIGYHSEVVDVAAIWNEDQEMCLKRDLATLQTMLNTPVYGVASHGGLTGLNNLDFWKDRKPSEFGLLYEAYDELPTFDLFKKSFYVSDSSWTFWKCYDNGVRRNDDLRTLGEHCKDEHPLIYSLIHPDTYYFDHIYE